jgi:hypothetical protein
LDILGTRVEFHVQGLARLCLVVEQRQHVAVSVNAIGAAFQPCAVAGCPGNFAPERRFRAGEVEACRLALQRPVHIRFNPLRPVLPPGASQIAFGFSSREHGLAQFVEVRQQGFPGMCSEVWVIAMKARQNRVQQAAVIALVHFFRYIVALVQAQQMPGEELIRTGHQALPGADTDPFWHGVGGRPVHSRSLLARDANAAYCRQARCYGMAPSSLMKRFQLQQPGRQRRRFAVNFRLPDQRHAWHPRQQIGECGARQQFLFTCAGQAKLATYGIIEDGCCRFSRQMGGSDAKNDGGIQIAGMPGGEVGQADWAGDAGIGKGGLFQMQKQPAPPVCQRVAVCMASTVVRQLCQQLQQLHADRVAAQGGLGANFGQ